MWIKVYRLVERVRGSLFLPSLIGEMRVDDWAECDRVLRDLQGDYFEVVE